MNQFDKDLNFAEKNRNRLKDFYSTKAFEGRYVFINKNNKLGSELQSKAIDTIFQVTDNKEVYIEEKIVRWKGNKLTAFALETESCTTLGREKDGWMKYGEFDYLVYGFIQANNDIELYIIPFKKLKTWFWQNYINFPITISKQINKTRCRIVKIQDVEKYVGFKTFIIK